MDPFLLSSSSISPFIKDSPFPSIHPSTPNRPCFLFLFYLPFYGIRFCKLYIRSFMNKERCSFSFRFVISLCIVIPTLPYSFFVVFDFGKTRIRDSLYKKNVSFSSFRFSPSRYLILLLFIYTFFFRRRSLLLLIVTYFPLPCLSYYLARLPHFPFNA